MTPDPAAIAARIRAGDQRTAARLIREIEDAITAPAATPAPLAEAVLRALYPASAGALVVGITGPAGAGKSTLVDALISHHRQKGDRVGVVAIDPSSPFTGGAVLGDRIRMQRHALDDGVFIRSLATRGQMGGLSRAAADVVTVMAAMGAQVVLVETVGVGQDETDIAGLADLVAVVLVPGLGDDVQAIKAGLLEVADVFVVNKADRDGADRVVADLAAMMALGEGDAPARDIIKTVASSGQGIADLAAALTRVREGQRTSGADTARRRRQATARLRALLYDRLRRRAEHLLHGYADLPALADAVARHQVDPYTAVDGLLGGANA